MITAISLALLLATIAVVFAARSLLQYRRTGDTGWRAPSRTADPAQTSARAVMIAACGLLLAAPVLDLFTVLQPIPILATAPIRIGGLVMAALAAIAIVGAQLTMGASWRIGVDPNESTTLVTSGLFALVRNPIFTAMAAFCLGLAVAVPNPVALAGALLTVIGIQWQVRGIEEPYLRRTHPDAYRRYAARTGRFLPGIGLLG